MTEDPYLQLCDAAGPVSRETYIRLQQFENFFIRWAGRMNLASPATLGEVWTRHVLDSAQLWPLAPQARHWLDVGSGGGFPGLVVSFLCAERDSAHVDLVEANSRKAGFLRAAIGQFELPARVHARRINALVRVLEQPEVVTARAVAPLSQLLELTRPWLTGGATALFHKGREYRRELRETGNSWRFDLVEHASRIDPESVILELRNVRQTVCAASQPSGGTL